jgi:hypothetical protein
VFHTFYMDLFVIYVGTSEYGNKLGKLYLDKKIMSFNNESCLCL